MTRLICILCFIFFGYTLTEAQVDKKFLSERDYCDRLAPKYLATVEHRLWDATRIDLYTSEEAIEVDFASKWAECYGQAEYYGIVSGKRPEMLLLVKDFNSEKQLVYRAQTLAAAHKPPMRLYVEFIESESLTR